jgi:hypothetical protein
MKKALMLTYIVLAIIDLINCTLPGQEVSMWLRPIQMFILLLWVNQHKNPPPKKILMACALLMAVFIEFIFYKYGSSLENTTITLIMIKSFFLIYLLYKDINKLRFTRKLLRWTFNYIAIFLVICALAGGKNNFSAYMLAIQSAIILLLISLRKSDTEIFRQKYLGYCLMIFSLIFGKILFSDSRWFIELIDRLSFVVGNFLFFAGLSDVKLNPSISPYLDLKKIKRSNA